MLITKDKQDTTIIHTTQQRHTKMMAMINLLLCGETVYKSQEAPHGLLHLTRRDLKCFQESKKPNA
jgi:hypothetical protein